MKKLFISLLIICASLSLSQNVFAEKQVIDLRKTGPLTFRQLQEANQLDFDYNNLDDELKRLVDLTWDDDSTPASSYFSSEPIKARSNTGDFGSSMWDSKTIGVDEAQHVGDLRAENQLKGTKLIAVISLLALIIGVILGFSLRG